VPKDALTIQAAIDIAAKLDTVLVADGVYSGEGNRNLMLRGHDIIVRSVNGPEHTVIDCGHETRAFFLLGLLTTATVIEGFTMANGTDSNDGLGGGAMFIGGCHPMITQCKFIDCVASGGGAGGHGGGGALSSNSSRSRIIDCSFSGNTATGPNCPGGGLVAHVSELLIQGCRFENNRVIGLGSVGGGVAFLNEVASAGLRLTDCEIVENEADHGGGVYSGGPAMVERCEIRNNHARIGGGGVHAIDCSLRSSIVIDNTAVQFGGGFGGGGFDTAVLDCAIQNNEAIVGGGLRFFARAIIANCLIAHNSAEDGGGAACSREPSVFTGCTVAMNSASRGSGIALLDFEPVTHSISRSIIANGVKGEAVACSGTASVVVECTNIHSNEGGDWIGCIQDQLGMKGNLHDDPRFCQPGSDWHLCSNSPCAPENTGACGLIGAFPVGCGDCGVQALIPSTWGQIKYQARRPAAPSTGKGL
jgi:hypothetical protein